MRLSQHRILPCRACFAFTGMFNLSIGFDEIYDKNRNKKRNLSRSATVYILRTF